MKLHTEISGRGPVLGMIHGWGLHGGIWGPAQPRLERDFRLVRVDLPGHGQSPRERSAFDLATAVEEVGRALPWRCHLLGWSLGATVALRFALDHPDRVRRLVLVGATPRFVAGPGWDCAMAPAVLDGFATMLVKDYRKTVQDFLTLQMRGDAHGASALRTLRGQVFEYGPPEPAALQAGLAVLAETDLRNELPGVQSPALVLSGDRDRLTPAEAGRRLADSLPHARFHAFHRCGHAPFLTYADDFADRVCRFLGGRESPHPSTP